MNSRRIAFMFCVLASSITVAATTPLCRSNPHSPSQRVFGTVGETDKWREYKSIVDVPAGGDTAQLWKESGGGLFVSAFESGEDFWTYTDYCFAKDGRLVNVKFEVRTAWGWAYRLEGRVMNGAIRAGAEGFSDTKTGKPIPRPKGADDIPEALKPTLYFQAKQLPFSKLLSIDPKSVPTPL